VGEKTSPAGIPGRSFLQIMRHGEGNIRKK
jgi:hypothetical protein